MNLSKVCAIGGSTITGEIPADPSLLSLVFGALLLLAYTVVLTVDGAVATERQDVP